MEDKIGWGRIREMGTEEDRPEVVHSYVHGTSGHVDALQYLFLSALQS